MKKLISAVLTVLMLLNLSACSGGTQRVSQTEECIPSNMNMSWESSIMENESGYYYNFSFDGTYMLRYFDKSSKEDIFCCNKPECAHDGNQFCAATSNDFFVSSSAMYDGAIYSFAYEENNGTLKMKLLRTEPDGTARSEVCTFLSLKNSGCPFADFMDGIILHRGRAFIDYSYCYTNSDGMGVGLLHYGKMMIDLSTGEYSEIPLPCGIAREDILYTARDSRLDGDWLYNIICTDEQGTVHCSLYRWNFITGESEKLDIPDEFSSYTVNDGIVYYTTADMTNKCVQIYRWYPENGKREKFTQPVFEKSIIETSIAGPNNDQPEVTTDREYIYYVDYGLASVISNDPDLKYYIEPECIVYSLDGTKLGSFVLPVEPRKEYDAYNLRIVNGTVYYFTYYYTLCCPLEDILNGKTQWTKLYEPAKIIE